MKLANRRAGYLSSLPLIRAGVAQRGNPALRGSRLPPTEGRIIERFSGWLGLYQLLGGGIRPETPRESQEQNHRSPGLSAQGDTD